ncbi:MAG: hypothetical protein JJU27_18735 [Gammaproteobacteria bacterium]|nr:hypothetical protein [Gammaproteobacteria bacterium]
MRISTHGTGVSSVVLALALLIPSAASGVHPNALPLMVAEHWNLTFTVTRPDETDMQLHPQIHQRQSIRTVATGSLLLQRPQDWHGGGVWEARQRVSASHVESATLTLMLPEGEPMIVETEASASHAPLGSARLHIDAEEGTYSLSVRSNPFPIDVNSVTRLDPEVMSSLEAMAAVPALAIMAHMVLRELEPKTLKRQARAAGGAFHDEPLPREGALRGRKELDHGVVLEWTLTPVRGRPVLFDDCPCGDGDEPELHVDRAARSPYASNRNQPEPFGQQRATELKRQVMPDVGFCDTAIDPLAIAAAAEVRAMLAGIPDGDLDGDPQVDQARQRVNRLIDDLAAQEPSMPQIRSLMYAQGMLQHLGDDDGSILPEAQSAYRDYARREIEQADITRALQLASWAQLLGMEDLGEEMDDRARDLARSELSAALDLFDPCAATTTDVQALGRTLAQFQLVDGDEGALDQWAQESLNLAINRLNGRSDPRCPEPRVGLERRFGHS